MLSAQVNYLTTPAAIVNQAVDFLGQSGKIIGDITDGTPVAETARRAYGQALRQLLRTAHWDFARKRAALTLLGDATGNSAAPVIQTVEQPWTYCWAWPIDGVLGRWLPWTPATAQPVSNTGVPLTTGVSASTNYWTQPGRFLVSSSNLYPIEVGQQTPWSQLPDLQRTFGLGPNYRKTILTDCADVEFVYTRFEPTIEVWDGLFRQAFVMMMALAIAPTAIENPQIRLAEVNRIVPLLRTAIADARVANGNESGMPQSVDRNAAWISARNGFSGENGGIGGGAYSGYTFSPFDSSMQWAGSVF